MDVDLWYLAVLYSFFIFCPLRCFLYYIVPFKYKNIVCLAASLFFYAWGEPSYLLLMLLSIVVNFFIGNGIGSAKSKRAQKLIFVSSIVFNIGLLFIFKYTAFFLTAFNAAFNANLYVPMIALPIGISFYTFHALSYIIDIYKKKAEPLKNIFDLALYISMFPQLVAGPIVRFTDINEQLARRTISLEKIAQGIIRFTIGLSKKVLIANAMAGIADKIFATSGFAFSTVTAWIGILAYTFQIYFDFSGYSDMAIGLGKMLGFELRENFDYPYMAKSATEFWRRWHISLGRWFRDYLYIPLGGNRKGFKVQIRNIFIVWFATGFWHGANWTFILWGLFWGVLLTVEKFTQDVRNRIPPVILHFGTLLCIVFGWVFFRANSLAAAIIYIERMIGIGTGSFADIPSKLLIHDNLLLFIAAAVGSTPMLRDAFVKLPIYKNRSTSYWILCALYIAAAFSISIVFLVNSVYNPFIYFRF